MYYTLEGVDPETGEHGELTLQANSDDQAMRKAARRGWSDVVLVRRSASEPKPDVSPVAFAAQWVGAVGTLHIVLTVALLASCALELKSPVDVAAITLRAGAALGSLTVAVVLKLLAAWATR